MKDLIKKWWFWVIVIIIVIIIIVISIVAINRNNSVGSAGISIEEFEQIQLGMGQSKVNSIIDTNDEWDNDEIYHKCCEEINKSSENHVYKYTYKYLGEKGRICNSNF